MAYRYYSYCENPKCGEAVGEGLSRLCPSCRYMAHRAFALGSFLAGIIAGLIMWGGR